MRRLRLVGLALLWSGSGWTLPPPIVPTTVTSDFGPRKIIPPGSPFHEGIDYASLDRTAPERTDVHAVEAGIIKNQKDIEHLGRGGWRLKVSADAVGRSWSYQHLYTDLFTDETMPAGGVISWGRFELRRDLIAGTTFPVFYVVRYADFTRTSVDKVFLDKDRLDVARLADPNFTLQGVPPSSDVLVGEAIGPVGTSGGVDPHLHLHLFENGDVTSPLHYVAHVASAFTVGRPETGALSDGVVRPGEEFGAQVVLGARLKTSVGLDLDQAALYLDTVSSGTLLAAVDYGGRPGVGPLNVSAVRAIGNGQDEITGVVAGSSLTAGSHTLRVVMTNILGQEMTGDVTFQVIAGLGNWTAEGGGDHAGLDWDIGGTPSLGGVHTNVGGMFSNSGRSVSVVGRLEVRAESISIPVLEARGIGVPPEAFGTLQTVAGASEGGGGGGQTSGGRGGAGGLRT